MPTQILSFSKQIAKATQDEQSWPVTVKGTVSRVLMAFPAGCHQLVEVRLIYKPRSGGRTFVVPTEDAQFIALDNFTATFEPIASVEVGGTLTVEWWNYDSRNAHTVPVIAEITPDGT